MQGSNIHFRVEDTLNPYANLPSLYNHYILNYPEYNVFCWLSRGSLVGSEVLQLPVKVVFGNLPWDGSRLSLAYDWLVGWG